MSALVAQRWRRGDDADREDCEDGEDRNGDGSEPPAAQQR